MQGRGQLHMHPHEGRGRGEQGSQKQAGTNLTPNKARDFDPTRNSTWADPTPSRKGIMFSLKWSKTLQATKCVTTIPIPALKDSILFHLTTWLHFEQEVRGTGGKKAPAADNRSTNRKADSCAAALLCVFLQLTTFGAITTPTIGNTFVCLYLYSMFVVFTARQTRADLFRLNKIYDAPKS